MLIALLLLLILESIIIIIILPLCPQAIILLNAIMRFEDYMYAAFKKQPDECFLGNGVQRKHSVRTCLPASENSLRIVCYQIKRHFCYITVYPSILVLITFYTPDVLLPPVSD